MSTRLAPSLLIIAALAGTASAQYTFQSFEDPGQNFTIISAINDRGQAAGESSDLGPGSGGFQSFMLQGPRQNRTPIVGPHPDMSVLDLNNSGSRVGRMNESGPTRTGYYSHRNTLIAVDGFPGYEVEVWADTERNGSRASWPLGINESGTAVGCFFIETDPMIDPLPYGFIIADGVMEELVVPGAADFDALWTISTGFPVPPVPAGYAPWRWESSIAAAIGVNNSNTIVGAYMLETNFEIHGFILKNNQFTFIEPPPGAFRLEAWDVNDAGTVVGLYEDANGENGFVYQDGILTTVNVPGSDWTRIAKLNNRGQLVGQYSADGKVMGFIASPSRGRP